MNNNIHLDNQHADSTGHLSALDKHPFDETTMSSQVGAQGVRNWDNLRHHVNGWIWVVLGKRHPKPQTQRRKMEALLIRQEKMQYIAICLVHYWT